MTSVDPKSRFRPEPIEIALSVLGIVSLAFSLKVMSVGFDNTLYDFHGFRQAQTAIAADSMLHGGDFLRYEVPVFGPPWSLPFEFPLYQGIAAALAKVFRTHLDQTGRFVSIAFYYLCFFPLASILSRLGLRGMQMIPTLSLFAVSPIYVFVSRLFMIESTALFFSLMYADQMFRLVQKDEQWRYRNIGGAAICGVIAGMVKVTTFAPYFALGSFLATCCVWKNRENLRRKIGVVPFVGLFCILFPVAATWCWTRFADGVKEQNPFGIFLTSSKLNAWTFGPFAERLHPRIYLQLVHATDNQVGNIWIAVAALLAYIWLCRKWNPVATACLVLYAGTILLFFNLHVVHEYYPYSNAIFLLVAIGMLIAALMNRSGFTAWIGLALLIAQMTACTFRYFKHFYPMQVKNAEGRPAAAAFIDSTTRPQGVIVILGLDWSPAFSYQSHRRSIMNTTLGKVPESWSLRPLEHSIANEGPQNIAALVACDQARYGQTVIPVLQDLGMAPSTTWHEDDCDIYERGTASLSNPSKH